MKLFVSAAALLLVVPFCGAARSSKELTDCLTAGDMFSPECAKLVKEECNDLRPRQSCMVDLLHSVDLMHSVCRTARCIGRNRSNFACICDSAVVDCQTYGGKVEGSCLLEKCCSEADSANEAFQACIGGMDGSEL